MKLADRSDRKEIQYVFYNCSKYIKLMINICSCTRIKFVKFGPPTRLSDVTAFLQFD